MKFPSLSGIVPGTFLAPALICAVVLGFGGAHQTRAGIVYATGFEPPQYVPGAISGQDGWTGPAAAIQTGVVNSGLQAAQINAQGPTDGGFKLSNPPREQPCRQSNLHPLAGLLSDWRE